MCLCVCVCVMLERCDDSYLPPLVSYQRQTVIHDMLSGGGGLDRRRLAGYKLENQSVMDVELMMNDT